MTDPTNDDLLPEHAAIDADLNAARREHVDRLAAGLDLNAGLAAILSQDAPPLCEDEAPDVRPDHRRVAYSSGMQPPTGQAAAALAMRTRARDLNHDLDRVRGALARHTLNHDVTWRTRAIDDARDALACALDLARDAVNHDDARDHDAARDALNNARMHASDARAIDDARDHDAAVDHTRALAFALADLFHDLARARALTRALTLTRDALDLALALASALTFTLTRDALDLTSDLALALNLASRKNNLLVQRLGELSVNASGADLSGLDLQDMSVLEGVVWTEETTWPPGIYDRVKPLSDEMPSGVYKVRGGSERDPADLISR